MIEWLGSSHFSFLEGASSPDVLFLEALRQGYQGLCLGDRMGLYGCVQALRAAEEIKKEVPEFFYAPGIRLHFDTADPLFVYPLHKAAYSRLCRYLSQWALDGMTLREKGLSPLPWKSFKNFLREQYSPAERTEHALPFLLGRDFVLISVSGRFYPWASVEKLEATRVRPQDAGRSGPSFSTAPTTQGQIPFWLLELKELCGAGAASCLQLAYPINLLPGVNEYQCWLEEVSLSLQIPLLASTLPLYAQKCDQELCDLVTAIRHKTTLKDLGYFRQASGERRLYSPSELQRVAQQWRTRNFLVDPLERGYVLKARHHFSLFELKYQYPEEKIPPGQTPAAYLESLTWAGAHERYPNGVPENTRAQLQKELQLIARLQYEDYFLTIFDVLAYARAQKILYQGRGSAANSAVCYCLGITAIDPIQMDLLFERFISEERHEPPDIDVDFEHERREEVIQEIYTRYGRHRAAMVASLICFQDRMAVRESAKALGLSPALIADVIKFMGREGFRRIQSENEMPEVLKTTLRQHKISFSTWQRLLKLSAQLIGFPRHLGLHTGGFILSQAPLDAECILEPARMADRSVIPWNKNDVEYLRWMKVDLLSLGMLTALRKCFSYIEARHQKNCTLANIPRDDARVYDSMCRADTVGVFQIESRAQMNMLPRLAPRNFYDIVIEVAIVRPGPLQGGMVHPYLRRRQKLEKWNYDHPDLEPILRKTLGVPIFQEQVMKMAVAVAGFTPGEADQLRKVMSGAWRSKSQMAKLKDKLFSGMRAKGIRQELTERLYKQMEGFGEYGFPESHSASFAILTYISTWVKVYYPAEFLCALLNSQPMGFYSPRSLIADAERHGVRALPIDVLYSHWETRITEQGVRLGLQLLKGLSATEGEQIMELQQRGILSPEHESLPSIHDLRRLGLKNRSVDLLLQHRALRSFPLDTWDFLKDRHQDLKQIKLLEMPEGPKPSLPTLDDWQKITRDYSRIGFRVQEESPHPVRYAKENFFRETPWKNSEELYRLAAGTRIFTLGLLAIKQKPPTAGGVVFLTLEDESGFINVALMPDVYEKCRLSIQYGSILAIEAFVEKSLATGAHPQAVALSLKVQRLWNPFLTGTQSLPLESRYSPRDFH